MLIFILIIVIIYSIIIKTIISKNKVQNMYYRDIPSNDAPAIVGKLVKGHTDGNDVVATILELIYKGYIRIEKEQVKGKETTVLYLEKNAKILELQEYEIFLIKEMFKNTNRVVFKDYIKSKNFKKDFRTFDQMIERRLERKQTHKISLLRNINKVLLLISYFVFGIMIFYSILLPIVLTVNKIININTKEMIIVTIIISTIIYFFMAYIYSRFINNKANDKENINLRIAYIILCIVFGIFLIINPNIDIYQILYNEFMWYKIIIDFLLSIVVLLYMFNIIKHSSKEEYIYYIFLIVSIFMIILNITLGIGICIMFFVTYIFFKSPKHINLKQEEEIYKWLGFKKYLEDYSMLSQQDSNAIYLWEKYLLYAISLGINKKIVKKYACLNNAEWIDKIYLKNVYVEYFE